MSGWTDLACRKRVQVPGSVPEGRPGIRLPVIPSPTVGGMELMRRVIGWGQSEARPRHERGGQTCGTTAHPITTVPGHADTAATALVCGLVCGLECGCGREDRARTCP